jgi:hypothetical protein
LPRTAYRRDALERIADHPVGGVAELLPWNFKYGTPVAQC